MPLRIKNLSLGDVLKAALRPTALIVGVIICACLIAVFFFAPFDQYILATILGLGGVALCTVISIHVLALTRWVRQIESQLELQNLEWQQLMQSVAKFDAYGNATDLNVGRLAAEQAKVEARVSELELGIDRAGVRLSEFERSRRALQKTERGRRAAKPKAVTARKASPITRRKTFFLHIPKCGGTTIWSVLRAIYGYDSEAVYQVKELPDAFFDALDIESRRKYNAVGGHGSLEYYKRCLGDLSEYYKIISLRDPIDRIISEYNYVMSLNDKGKANFSSSFEAFALHYPANAQVFALTSRVDDVEGALDAIHNFFDDWTVFPHIENLLSRICSALSSVPQNWSPLNLTNYRLQRQELPNEIVELLETRNAADLEVWKELSRTHSDSSKSVRVLKVI